MYQPTDWESYKGNEKECVYRYGSNVYFSANFLFISMFFSVAVSTCHAQGGIHHYWARDGGAALTGAKMTLAVPFFASKSQQVIFVVTSVCATRHTSGGFCSAVATTSCLAMSTLRVHWEFSSLAFNNQGSAMVEWQYSRVLANAKRVSAVNSRSSCYCRWKRSSIGPGSRIKCELWIDQ